MHAGMTQIIIYVAQTLTSTWAVSHIPIVVAQFISVSSKGLFFVLPCTDDVRVVDLRTITFDVHPQEVEEPYI